MTPGGAAEQAGLAVGDKIASINGKSTSGLVSFGGLSRQLFGIAYPVGVALRVLWPSLTAVLRFLTPISISLSFTPNSACPPQSHLDITALIKTSPGDLNLILSEPGDAAGALDAVQRL